MLIVTRSPPLYSQNAQPKSLELDSSKSFSSTKMISGTMKPSTSRWVCSTLSCVNPSEGKSLALVNSR